MRWPWVSRDRHEEVVTLLRQQLAEAETERKRVQDAYYVALGVTRIHFPDVRTDTQTPAVLAEVDPVAERRAQIERDLAYTLKTRPSQLGAKLAEVLRVDRVPLMPTQVPQPTVATNGHKDAKALFDQAEAEVKEKHGA